VIPTGLQTKEGSSNEEPHLKASIGAATSGSRRWLRLACSLKLEVSFAKEPYKGDDILQKRPIILRSLPIEATPKQAVAPPNLAVALTKQYILSYSPVSHKMGNREIAAV